jgi:hypothetical protein
MRRPRTPLRFLALVALALSSGACKQSDSILLVIVYGPRSVVATHLSVTVTSGIDARNITVQPSTPSEPINLPASFTIALDRSHMGPITISIDALDDGNAIVAFGTTMMQHIEIGGQTDLAVMLMVGLPPDTGDGGADGPVDVGAGGSGGSADAGDAGGPGGTGGAGGAGGQGGASGMDASVDGDDAIGLDGATD